MLLGVDEIEWSIIREIIKISFINIIKSAKSIKENERYVLTFECLKIIIHVCILIIKILFETISIQFYIKV